MRRRHWRVCLRITAVLLALWAALTFGVAFFAREIGGSLLGWPFGFWLAAQGAPLVYLVLVAVYAGLMNRLDDRCDATGDTVPGASAPPSR